MEPDIDSRIYSNYAVENDHDDVLSKPESTMITINGSLNHPDKIHESEFAMNMVPVGNIERIISNYGCIDSDNYCDGYKKLKVSNRGRKPIPKNKKHNIQRGTGKAMNSQTTFVVRSNNIVEDTCVKCLYDKKFRTMKTVVGPEAKFMRTYCQFFKQKYADSNGVLIENVYSQDILDYYHDRCPLKGTHIFNKIYKIKIFRNWAIGIPGYKVEYADDIINALGMVDEFIRLYNPDIPRITIKKLKYVVINFKFHYKLKTNQIISILKTEEILTDFIANGKPNIFPDIDIISSKKPNEKTNEIGITFDTTTNNTPSKILVKLFDSGKLTLLGVTDSVKLNQIHEFFGILIKNYDIVRTEIPPDTEELTDNICNDVEDEHIIDSNDIFSFVSSDDYRCLAEYLGIIY